MHLPVAKYLIHLRAPHVHLSLVQFDDVVCPERQACEHLGSVEQQKDRLVRLFWLLLEFPRVPKPPKWMPSFTFEQLFTFEAEQEPLKFNFDKHQTKHKQLD